jgi:hypothetical protein
MLDRGRAVRTLPRQPFGAALRRRPGMELREPREELVPELVALR